MASNESHTIHLVSVGANGVSELDTVRAVREAMRTLGFAFDGGNPPGLTRRRRASAVDANLAISETIERGYCLIGESDNLTFLMQVAQALELNGCEAFIDFDPRELDDDDEPPRHVGFRREDGPTPEEVFAGKTLDPPDERPTTHDTTAERPVFSTEAYETALAILATTEGKPLMAAWQAHTLGRTTQDMDLYNEVINALIVTFPWIAQPLEANDLIEPSA